MADLKPVLALLNPRTILERVRRPSRPVWITCSLVGGAGIVLFGFVAFIQKPSQPVEMLLLAGEHAASALVVASVMGLTYEFYLHRLREKHDQARLTEAISSVSTVLPLTVFNLIAEMAVRARELPTLFYPPRSTMREFVLTQDHDVLRQLLALAAARHEEAEVLSWWFHSDAPYRLKFFGSDLVGLFKRKAFVPTLRAEAERHLADWQSVPDRDKGWVLNFVWAVSRCEEPMYQWLEELLLSTPYQDIRDWILFVPQQMPHPILAGMISRYMRRELHSANRASLQLVLDAVPRLHIKRSQKKLIRKYGPVFRDAGLEEKYAEVRAVTERRSGVDRRTVSRPSKDRRGLQMFELIDINLDRYDNLPPE